MVALFITAILFAMGYGAINQALTHRGAIEEQQARLLAVQTTMRVLAQDFGQLAARPVRDPIGDTWQPALLAKGQPGAVADRRVGELHTQRAGPIPRECSALPCNVCRTSSRARR